MLLPLALAETMEEIPGPPPAPPAPVTAPHAVESWALASGDQVLLAEDHAVGLVGLLLQVPGGTWTPELDDLPVEEAFELSLYDADGSLRARADALAAEIDLQVGARRAVLELSCLTEDLDAALALVVDVLHTTSWDTGELRRSDQSRRLGYRSQLEEPRFILQRAASELVYAPGDPRLRPFAPPEAYARDPEALAAARDRLLASPGRLIGFVGDVDHDTADRLARTLVEALPDPNAPAPSAPAWLPLRTDLPETAVETMRNINQVQFAWFSTGLAWSDDRLAAWRIADHVLAGHFYARLYVALRHEGGETYGVGSLRTEDDEPTGYGVWTFTREANRDVTRDKLLAAVARFHDEGITETELDEAKRTLMGERLFARQSPFQAMRERLFELGTGRPEGFEDAMTARIEALTLDEVNAFIRDFYDPARFTLLTVEPK